MDFYELEGNKDLARDPKTNAIVNVNGLDYTQYLSTKNVKSEKNQKLQTVEKDLANVKGELNEIKLLLKELLNGSRSN
jgi:hypothetical protein|tara:strand:- start:4642 stop:4875 length:234 start_codon:yes stop_codon:yes gene_type:complete